MRLVSCSHVAAAFCRGREELTAWLPSRMSLAGQPESLLRPALQ